MNLLSLNSEGALRTTMHRRIPHSNRHISAETTQHSHDLNLSFKHIQIEQAEKVLNLLM